MSTEQKKIEKFARRFWEILPMNDFTPNKAFRVRNSTDLDDIIDVMETYIERAEAVFEDDISSRAKREIFGL